ncbi:hypothetical protein M409DRAFT_61007 [Zasmidium cellare ATCC 36951]|uniref:Uncharacterized protein n=1 Tax=Zasmidium cellare ATCC 36951 TaxID=1080233 RepID=A0A6A6BWI8_ZASCE|nr:uncharacterized protein M409DRAFT_61007 [Zasmidium cellare ATCC 36951]KAF2159181.1 hypothetical protein M409DRAFT_61007 [Zasmidium cellare ATCC 36951]
MAATHHFDVNRLFSVKDYVCIVTGGATGIGLMATQALAANGAKVYITGRRAEVLENAAKHHSPEQERTGGQIIPLGPCDVRKKEDLQRIVEELSKKEKYINVLVCNAGVAGPKAEPKEETASDLKKTLWENESVEEWQQTMETDVTSVYFTTVAFLPLLQAAIGQTKKEVGGNGEESKVEPYEPSVITISSMSGLMRHAQGHFSYNAAKGATVHLTKLMSAEFQKLQIRINSIAPGYFPSEMTAKESDEKNKSGFPEGKIEQTGHVPLMRAGRDEEIGMAVLQFAKNAYVNGDIMAVDGGVLNVVSGR